MRAWCDTCAKETTRYVPSGRCRFCATGGFARKGGLAAQAKHGNPGTPEARRRGGLASIAGHGGTIPQTPEQRAKAGMAGGYRSGRVRLGQAIARKRELVPEIEAELASMGVVLPKKD
jgi:hypothetical protein